MKRIDQKVEDICHAIYVKGYEIRMSRKTAQNLVDLWQEDQKNPARPTMTLPSRIRNLARGPQVNTQRVFKRV